MKGYPEVLRTRVRFSPWPSIQSILGFELSWPPGASPGYFRPDLAGALW